jgi:molecular chaperone HtpG
LLLAVQWAGAKSDCRGILNPVQDLIFYVNRRKEMNSQSERHEFQAEVKQLLDLMIHSLYSNKDIFLRELVSNSSDALDRLRFEALTRPEILPEKELQIFLETDSKGRVLAVHDNGIGMSRDEVIQNIGTIARSGTMEFLKLTKNRQEQGLPPDLIGQFGVGFYSTFMVAEKIVLVTRKAGEETATRWESAGEGGYQLTEDSRPEVGTSVYVHLKPEDQEDGIKDYTAEWTIKSIISKYSNFVAYPIKLKVERKESEKDEEGKPKKGAVEKTVVKEETLNSMKAIWTRPRQEVGDEEYQEFYKHISHDWNKPLEIITARLEGNFEAQALLFIPSKSPMDLMFRGTSHHGIHLYVKRVFIMDDCKELMPEYLRFVQGVVDSESLSLNVSREILQQDRQIKAIRNFLVKKVLDTLKEMQEKQNENYLAFWKEFGPVLKQGLLDWQENKERILPLVLCQSSHHESSLTSLKDYLSRMKEGQETIYFMTGSSREAVAQSPHLEAFRDKGYEVLYLTDPVDEIWVQSVGEYEGKKLKSAGKGEVELGSEEEKKKAEEGRKEKETACKGLIDALKIHLEEEIKEVRLSARLTSSPVCLVGEPHDLSPQMELLMKQMGQPIQKAKRILELNPNHPLLDKLQAIFEKDPSTPQLKDYAWLLYGQALLAEGSPLPDPARYSKLVAELMVKAI